MERFPWHPRSRRAGITRRIMIAALAALTLMVVAAVGIAATRRTKRLSDRQERQPARSRTSPARAAPDRGIGRALRSGERGDTDLHA